MKPIHEFGAFEAKEQIRSPTRLGRERGGGGGGGGEEVTITRHGREVARLVPAGASCQPG